MKKRTRRIITVCAISLALILISGLVLLWFDLQMTQARELDRFQLRLDAIAESVHFVEKMQKSSRETFEKHFQDNLNFMASILADDISEEGYSGPMLFRDGAMVEIRGDQVIWPENIPEGFPDISAGDLREGKIITAEIPSPTDDDPGAVRRLTFMTAPVQDPCYYVDWTEEKEIQYGQYNALNDQRFLEAAEQFFDASILLVSTSDPSLPLLIESASRPGVKYATELGFTPEIIAERRHIVHVNGTRSLCNWAEVENGTAVLIHIVPYHSLLVSSIMHVGLIEISILLILATLIAYIISIRKCIRTKQLSKQQESRYRPKSIRTILFLAGITGAIVVFVSTFVFQTIDALHKESIYGAKTLNSLFEYLQDSTMERLESDRQQDAEWIVYHGQEIADLISRRPENGSSEKLQKYCDKLGFDFIMLFDYDGKQIATNSDFTDFRIDSGLGENSSDFKRLLKGIPSIVHDASTDPVTGLTRQMIGVTLPMTNEAGEKKHGALIIAVVPKENQADNAKLSEQFSFLVNEYGRLCFFTDQEKGEIQYSSDVSLIGKTIYDCGLPEKSMTDGYTDFASVNGVHSYVTMVKQKNQNFFLILPNSSLLTNTLPTAVSGVIAYLVIFMIVMGISLRGYDSEINNILNGNHVKHVEWMDPEIQSEAEEGEKRYSFSELFLSGRRAETIWQKRTPENNVATILKIDILLLIIIPALCYVISSRTNRGVSLFSFILNGDWMRGFNLFSVCGILIVFDICMLILFLCNILLSIIAGFTGRGGETICRLLYSILRYIALMMMLYYIFEYIGLSMSTYIASLSMVSLALSIGSRDMVSDIIAGIMILFESQFQVGDIVEIDNIRGKVLEMGVRSVKLLTPGNDVRFINNSNVLSVVNKSKRISTYTTEIRVITKEPLETIEELFRRELPIIGKRNTKIKVGLAMESVTGMSGGGEPGEDRSISIRIKCNCRERDRDDIEDYIKREIYLLCERENLKLA